MVANLHLILEDLKASLAFSNENRLKPGALLENDATLRHIRLLAEATDSKGTKLPEADPKTRFYIFLLIVNHHLGTAKSKPSKSQENEMQSLALTLDITPELYLSVMTFYCSDKPFVDTADTVYIAFELSDRLIRSKGVNVYFTNHTPGEVIYLKYIEPYDLFLAKTFTTRRSYNSITGEINTKVLDIITEKNYPELNYELPSFSELKSRLKNFDALQHVEISEMNGNPNILLDPEKGLISISGASSPLSTTVYFDPIFDWLNLYDLSGKKPLSVYFHFKYYNTYTSKFLVNFVWECNRLLKKGKSVSFYWYHDVEDDEMREFGEYLQTRFNEGDKFHILENFKEPKL